MERGKFFFMLILLVFSSTVVLAGDKLVGDSACADCHEEVVNSFNKSFHKLSFKSSDEFRCEACHGGGAAHVDSEDPANILGPSANLKKLESNCLSCHSKVMGGVKEHHVNVVGLGCTSCHKIHQPLYKGTLTKPENVLCADCHKDVKAKMYLPSHHPVKEGKMGCSDCHKFDGTENANFERTNDTCLSCHAQYRGPFVFEHSPVAEDCKICHDPHGSVADNLLKQNEPFVCLQCHQMHFHANLGSVEGEYTLPNHSDRSVTSTRSGSKRSMLTKCTQCHPMVHGSDLPSEAISGQGKALTR